MLTLCRISTETVKRNYIKGEYSNVVLPKLSSKNVSRTSVPLFQTNYSEDVNEGIFRIPQKSGCSRLVASDNCNYFSYVNSDGKSGDIKGRCDYCHRKLNRLKALGKTPKHIITSFTSKITDDDCGRAIGKGIFCDERCAYTKAIENKSNRPFDHSAELDAYYTYMEYAARTGEDLQPRKPAKLLQKNGGPLDDDAWEDNRSYTLVTNPVIAIHPSKNIYVKS